VQDKPKNNLSKILLIAILLSFTIILVGCNWLSFGLLNIFDPQAQIRVDYRLDNLTAEGIANIWFTIFSLNEAEFIGEQFLFEYYNQGIKIPELSRTIGATFYVPPSPLSSFESPVSIPKETEPGFPVYFQDVIDYMALHPTIVELDATITVMGTDGAGHSISKTIAFDLPALLPGIDFTPPTAEILTIPAEDENGKVIGTTPFIVIFDASGSTDVDSGIASVIWDFGDGTTGTEMTENHTYNNPGIYNVILTVTDFYGNTGYDTVTITVNEPLAPIAVINTVPIDPTGSAPFSVYFDAYKSAADPGCEFGCEIVSYSWDFGDETTGTEVATNHIYDNPGLYIVTLTVTDLNSKEGYDTVTITVNEPLAPTVKINTTPAANENNLIEGDIPFKVYFNAYGSVSGSMIVSYDWEFGDGGTGSGITTNHTYNVPGIYIVYLTITDNNGYEAYNSVYVAVGAAGDVNAVIKSTPDAEQPSGTDPFTVGFDASDSTTSASGARIVSYTWDFDHGASIVINSETSPTEPPIPVVTYKFTPAGTHLVQLTVEDSEGNKGYAFKSITVTAPL
jgi:PKD repeat protein